MRKNGTNLLGTLLAVGAIGATAGMLAWRWSQRHRAQRFTYHRDLSRWEGEGGALASNVSGTVDVAAASASGVPTAGVAGVASAAGSAPQSPSNGVDGTPWPFPHGNA